MILVFRQFHAPVYSTYKFHNILSTCRESAMLPHKSVVQLIGLCHYAPPTGPFYLHSQLQLHSDIANLISGLASTMCLASTNLVFCSWLRLNTSIY